MYFSCLSSFTSRISSVVYMYRGNREPITEPHFVSVFGAKSLHSERLCHLLGTSIVPETAVFDIGMCFRGTDFQAYSIDDTLSHLNCLYISIC